jgi:hypothetical protein
LMGRDNFGARYINYWRATQPMEDA